MDKKSFLGKGWAFPPSFNKTTGNVEMVKNEIDIKQSLVIYFNTKLGERIMRPDYGCVLHDNQFEKINQDILESLIFEMKNNIGYIEPRINVNKLYASNIDFKNGVVQIKLEYTVISTNIRDNIVYPYYINEGTNIQK